MLLLARSAAIIDVIALDLKFPNLKPKTSMLDVIHKWRLSNYSFVFMLIILPSLTLKRRNSLRPRLQLQPSLQLQPQMQEAMDW